MNIGPTYIKLPNTTKPPEEQRIYRLLDDEKINFLTALRKDEPPEALIKVFACQNMKTEENNYCMEFCKDNPKNKICMQKKANQYVFFFIDESTSDSTPQNPFMYLLVFTESTTPAEIQKIVVEVKTTVKWLEESCIIVHNKICCYIFKIFPPKLFDTNLDIRGIFEEKTGFECEQRNLPPCKCLLIRGGSPEEFNITVVEPPLK
jgi:hypothetical protein